MVINVSVSTVILQVINEAAKKYYKGNRSKFLMDAGLKYAQELCKKEKQKSK